MDKLKTGSGKRLRAEALTEVALPVPYDAAAMPGATVLGTDGQIYNSIKIGGVYQWAKNVATLETGEILLGTASPRTDFNTGLVAGGVPYTPAIQIEGGTDGSSSIAVTRYQPGAASPSRLVMAKTRGTVPLQNTIVQFNDLIGALTFMGADGNELIPGAVISAIVDDTPDLFDVPMALQLRTRQKGAGPLGVIGRMRISHDGFVRINNTTGTVLLSVGDSIQITETNKSYMVGTNNVVGSRKTGWAAPTGTATRSAFATSSVTTTQLAERVKALIDDLTSHGLIGA